MSSPHQRVIKVVRNSDKATKDYFKISHKNFYTAMYNLKTNSFKLYCYLCDNKDGYEFDLYPCDFQRLANVKDDTYRSAFNDLMEKGYLLPHKTKKTVFMFLEESNNDLSFPDKADKIESLNKEDFDFERKNNFT